MGKKWGRHGRDMGKIWGRYGGDMGGVYLARASAASSWAACAETAIRVCARAACARTAPPFGWVRVRVRARARVRVRVKVKVRVRY